MSRQGDRNVIGSVGGAYALYRALAVSAGALDPIRRPDLTNTYPAVNIGPFPQWSEPARIVSLDPWGHMAAEAFKTEIAEGIDIRPTIAVTKARLDLYEMQSAIAAGRLKADGDLVHANGTIAVSKIAIDPVWYLPGVAERFSSTETGLRRILFEQTAGMFPELVTAARTFTSSCRRSAARRFICLVTRTSSPTPRPGSPAGSTTSATARTCSAPTSAPAGLI